MKSLVGRLIISFALVIALALMILAISNYSDQKSPAQADDTPEATIETEVFGSVDQKIPSTAVYDVPAKNIWEVHDICRHKATLSNKIACFNNSVFGRNRGIFNRFKIHGNLATNANAYTDHLELSTPNSQFYIMAMTKGVITEQSRAYLLTKGNDVVLNCNYADSSPGYLDPNAPKVDYGSIYLRDCMLLAPNVPVEIEHKCK